MNGSSHSNRHDKERALLEARRRVQELESELGLPPEIARLKAGQIEELARLGIDLANDEFFLTDAAGFFIFANSAACRRLEYSREELCGLHVADVNGEITREGWAEHWSELKQLGSLQFETRQRSRSGRCDDIEVTTNYLAFDGQEFTCAFARDISARRRAESIMQARLRLHQFAAGHSLQELLQATLDEAGKLTGSPFGFYHFLAEDQKTLHLQAWSTRTMELCQAELPEHYRVDHAGVWIDCIRQQGPVIHNDYAALPHRRGLPEGHVEVKREMLVPVMRHARIVAILGLGNKATDYSGKDLETVSLLADLAWDIAEQKRAEEQLRGSEEKYRFLAENTRDVIWTMDLAAERFTYVSPSAEKLRGFTADEVMRQTLEDMLAPGSLAKVRELMGSILPRVASGDAEARSNTLELEQFCNDGSTVWTEVTTDILTDEQSGALHVLGITRDISKRKLAEEALLASEERFRSLFQTMQEGFALHEIICDAEGTPVDYRFLDINPAFERLTGLSRKQTLGRTVRELLPQTEQSWIDRYGDVALTGQPRQFENYAVEQDRFFEVNAYCPKPGQFAVLFSDATERRRLQDELIKTQKLESLGVLAGGIAHDFNNILAGILGNLSLIRLSAPVDRKMTERLASCEKALQRASDLASQLLTFARGGDPVKKSLDLRSLIEETATFNLRGSKSRSQLQIAPDLWPIEADATQISQLLGNLILNAEQAMPGGGTIRIRAGNRNLDEKTLPLLPSGDYVRILISDQGGGIPREHLDKIFDPYFTTKNAGSGLGLTTAYSIARRHGGHIKASSRSGKGATFEVYLPASPQAETITDQAPLPTPLNTQDTRILIMDDDQLVLEILKDMLEFLGYRVTTSKNGESAVDLYRRALSDGETFDAVIVDLTVRGGMGGREAAQEILALDPNATLLVSSGYSNDPVMADHLRYGFAGAVSKPFRTEDLSAVLQPLLARQGTFVPGGAADSPDPRT